VVVGREVALKTGPGWSSRFNARLQYERVGRSDIQL